MNTIKYSCIFDTKTETHDVEFYKRIKLNIAGVDYEVDNHASMMIYPTISCNGKCDFCINKYDNNFKKMIDCKKEYFFNKLNEIFNLFKDVKPAITICGGEPTISENTIGIMKLVNKYGFPVRTFPTNGLNLLKNIDGKPFIQYMVEYGFNKNINLSIQHYNEKINSNIMGFSLTRKEIETIGLFSKVNHLELRTSCNLIKNGINSLNDMEKYLKYFSSFNISSSIFRELIKVDNNYYNNNFVNIDSIIENINNDKNYQFIRKMNGAYYNVFVYRFDNYLVKVYKEKFQKDVEYIRDFIFGSDGHLYMSNVNDDNKLIY